MKSSVSQQLLEKVLQATKIVPDTQKILNNLKIWGQPYSRTWYKGWQFLTPDRYYIGSSYEHATIAFMAGFIPDGFEMESLLGKDKTARIMEITSFLAGEVGWNFRNTMVLDYAWTRNAGGLSYDIKFLDDAILKVLEDSIDLEIVGRRYKDITLGVLSSRKGAGISYDLYESTDFDLKKAYLKSKDTYVVSSSFLEEIPHSFVDWSEVKGLSENINGIKATFLKLTEEQTRNAKTK